MTRQLISTNKQPLLRSSHAKCPPQSGFVLVALPETSPTTICCARRRLADTTAEQNNFVVNKALTKKLFVLALAAEMLASLWRLLRLPTDTYK